MKQIHVRKQFNALWKSIHEKKDLLILFDYMADCYLCPSFSETS